MAPELFLVAAVAVVVGATLRPIFLGTGVFSVAAKTLVGATGFVAVPPWVGPLLLGSLLAGLGLGTWLEGRVTATRAQKTAIVLAGLGGAVTIIRGVIALAAT